MANNLGIDDLLDRKPNPLEQVKIRSRVRVIVGSILGIHVVLVGALFYQGCKQEKEGVIFRTFQENATNFNVRYVESSTGNTMIFRKDSTSYTFRDTTNFHMVGGPCWTNDVLETATVRSGFSQRDYPIRPDGIQNLESNSSRVFMDWANRLYNNKRMELLKERRQAR